ncbi:MAG: dihydroorotate dehydrogenase [Nocardioidaceae bacterium]
MALLDIDLGALHLKNPVIAGSSEFTMTERGIKACIDAGAGAVVAKSINERPDAARQLDIADYVLIDGDRTPVPWSDAATNYSLLNRSGLAQTPVDQWLDMLQRCNDYARSRDATLIGSITVSEPEPAAAIAARMMEVVPCVEINLSAPHGREARAGAVRQVCDPTTVGEFTSTVRASVDGPFIVKLTAQANDPVDLAEHAVASGAPIVAMIGRFPAFLPSLDTGQPMLGSWAAIGGSWALPISLYWVSKSHLALPAGTPIIGTNGARDGSDVLRFLLSGASAVEMASAVLVRGPAALTDAVDEVASHVRVHGVGVTELIGAAARASRSYAQLLDDHQTTNPSEPPWQHFLDG